MKEKSECSSTSDQKLIFIFMLKTWVRCLTAIYRYLLTLNAIRVVDTVALVRLNVIAVNN